MPMRFTNQHFCFYLDNQYHQEYNNDDSINFEPNWFPTSSHISDAF
ncbi:hypothetical protein VCHA57P526_40119 [Vibrio chagasii]|nr:hypothetical protein VCHA37P193_130030 [Vibrio chagasii]CAH6926294.1 hypothetical protein VCHA40O236_130091 [Vibrio chagasii]CAH6977917.1 hypothetical protein VCHA55P509_150089 [Vibrio chagasii]CAH6982682.1 hypothetical protein VCHA54P500_130090 [Vibrio chagasii]CAH7045886.1 hypothetical protein VCHA41O246_10088 [Vibrio chagasii]